MARARRTYLSNKVFRLPGGTEDNDLWVQVDTDSKGGPVLRSTWELDKEEREAIANGANVELFVWGAGTPPVCISTTTVPLGKAPDDEWPDPSEDPPDPL